MGKPSVRVNANGVELDVKVRGAGEPVLLVHGFPLTGAMWLPAMEHLPTGFTYIVPDLRGHGESTATDSWTMADLADDLAAVLDELEERRRVVLVGLSMGGYVAMEFCRRYEACVRALALVDTRAEADTPAAAEVRFSTAAKVLAEGTAVVANAMAEKLFAPSTPAPLRDYWKHVMLETSSAGMAGSLRAMAGRVDSFPTLRRLRIPVLIVVGAQDVITPPDCAQAMHEAVPQSQLHVMPNVGHMAPVEAPREFAAILGSFLSSLPVKTK